MVDFLLPRSHAKFELTYPLIMNSDPPKYNATLEVPLMYLRILLTVLQCSLPGSAINRLTNQTTCAIPDLVQIMAYIRLPIADAYGT